MPTDAPAMLQISRLSVQDFGPVKSADVHVGDLTILMGPQSSGKTYLASLIYGLQRVVPQSIHFGLFTAVTDTLRESGVTGLVPKETLQAKLRDLSPRFDTRFHEVFAQALPATAASLLRNSFLVSSLDDLIRDGAGSARVSFEFSAAQREIGRFSFTLERGKAPVAVATLDREWLNDLGTTFENLVIVPGGGASGQGPRPFFSGANYVPADRILIVPAFAQTLNLILALYRNALAPGALPGLPGQPSPQLRQATFDFVQDLNGALALSGEIPLPIGGVVKVKDRAVTYSDTKRSVELPLTRASSGATQLAGLYLISERTGENLLVVEEPESNLHLDAEIAVGDYLASLAATHRRRVVITTHSEHLVERMVLQWSKFSGLDLALYFLDENDVGRELVLDRQGREFELPPTIERALEKMSADVSSAGD